MKNQRLKWELDQFHLFMVVFDQGGFKDFWQPCCRTETYRFFLSNLDSLDLQKYYLMDRIELFHRMNDSLTLLHDSCSQTIGDIEQEPKALTYLFIILQAKDPKLIHSTQSPTNLLPQGFLDKMLKQAVHPALMAMRALTFSLVCEVQYKCSLPDLVGQAKRGDEPALLKLVKLDPATLSTPFARKALELKSITCDDAFFSKLSSAIRPNPRFFKMQDRRNQYALQLLASLGYIDRPYRDWAEFFTKFNVKYCEGESELKKFGFNTYEDESTLAKACKRYGVPKIHAAKRRNIDT